VIAPNYTKVEDWGGRPLPGEWLVTYKVNGIRALSDGKHVVARSGKSLYGLDNVAKLFQDAEIYCGSFANTQSVLRTRDGRQVRPSEVFGLRPLDWRLVLGTITNATPNAVRAIMHAAVAKGYEGIVLRKGDLWWREKELQTYDVVVRGITIGKGKRAGKVGAFITDMGKVGGGFSDVEGERLNNPLMIGKTIEVACQHLTPAGKFRHARLIQVRWDK